MVRFIFDLDGTLTKSETLPIISEHFSLQEKIAELTMQTVQGNIPFEESFVRRVSILRKCPVSEVSELLATVALHENVHSFIAAHSEHCIIATSNLFCWVDKLTEKIGCKAFYSEALVENDTVTKITSILCKESVVDFYKQQGDFVVFIGDGHNDMEAMRLADVSIATGLVHAPAKSIVSIADYVVDNEDILCDLLNKLLNFENGQE